MKRLIIAIILSLVAPAQAVTLKGHASNSEIIIPANSIGVTGLVVSHSGHGVSQVVKNSPADWQHMKKGDIILEVDGHKGHNHLPGKPMTWAQVTYKRGKEIKYVEILRLDEVLVYGGPANEWKELHEVHD